MGEVGDRPQVAQALACSQQENSLVLGARTQQDIYARSFASVGFIDSQSAV
jgi:hypothetical protein